MSPHAPLLPLLIPILAALCLLLQPRIETQRIIGLLACLLGVAASAWLTALADQGPLMVYALGDWAAPFGIVLVADRLAAAMTLLTAVLALGCLLYASAGFDAHGRFFHPLFQLQLLGLNGAFLTGDLFNLFVFFEIMLLASYALLAQGGGLARTRAGIAYVVLNLLGSSLFLIALGLLYGTLGTLNLADVALRLGQPGIHLPLARLALALLVAVFLLKAALLPLSFWLPQTYAAAPAPVAALFAIMTKVGIVALLRVQVIAIAPAQSDLLADWLPMLALATLAFGTVGCLAAGRLKVLAAWLVLISAGTLLLVPSHNAPGVTTAGLFYLIHSTFAGAGLFLLAELISEQRGSDQDRLVAGSGRSSTTLAIAFLLVAMTLAGLPPFSGFLAKLMLLGSLREAADGMLIWGVVLVSALFVAMLLARAGSLLFWAARARQSDRPSAPRIGVRRLLATLGLIAGGPLLMILAQPLTGFAQRTATQLHEPGAYIQAVLGPDPQSIQRQTRE